MYNVYNENGELVGQNLTEDQLIDLANEEFAETDNMDDAKLSLNEFGFKVVEL